MNFPIGEYLIVGVISIVIIFVGYIILYAAGTQERAQKATIQAMRWLVAGAVIAVIGDAFSKGDVSQMLISGALGLVGFMVLEYMILRTEDKVTVQ